MVTFFPLEREDYVEIRLEMGRDECEIKSFFLEVLRPLRPVDIDVRDYSLTFSLKRIKFLEFRNLEGLRLEIEKLFDAAPRNLFEQYFRAHDEMYGGNSLTLLTEDRRLLKLIAAREAKMKTSKRLGGILLKIIDSNDVRDYY